MGIIAEVAPISDLRRRQNELIARLAEGPVILTQRGRGTAVLLSMARWQQLIRQVQELTEAVEDAEDTRASDEMERRIASDEETTYSHDEVWAEIDRLETEGGLPEASQLRD